VLFRRAVQLCVSSKHWAEVTCGRAIRVLSVMNKSRIAIKTRRIILLLSPEGSFCIGNHVVLKLGRPIGYHCVFGMAVETTSSVAGSGFVPPHARSGPVRPRGSKRDTCVLAAEG
jgi:hypothetical protein